VHVPVALLLGKWIHFAWILSEDSLSAYVNGVKHSSSIFKQDWPSASWGQLLIGGRWKVNDPVPSYPSQIQHFAVYPRTLSEEEIRAQLQVFQDALRINL